MQLSAIAAVVLAASAVVYLCSCVVDCLRHAARARELGCEPPPKGPFWDFIGVHGVTRGILASREKKLPPFFYEWMAESSRRHGHPVRTVRVRSPFFRDGLFTVDPQNIKTMLALKFKDFGLGVNRTDNFRPLLGDGIFAANGQKWEHSRALLRPQFVRSQVSDLDLEESHVQALLTVLERSRQTDGWSEFVDLQPLFFRLTLDSATEFLFGESVNSQLGATERHARFARAFDKSQDTLSLGARLGVKYWLVHNAEFRRNVAEVHGWVDRFVKMAIDRGCDGDEKTAGAKYVFLHALSRETQDPNELRSQLLNILLAARDTTASTLSWFFLTMADARNAHVFHRLRQVIIDEFNTYSSPRDITFERIKSCQYLQWCIAEILRLYPAVSLNIRTALVDTVLPTGGGAEGHRPIYVRKGEDVSYAVHAMHRLPELWGEDAHMFRPERWQDRKPNWDYLPFNGGPRICIGQQFALTQIGFVVIRLLQRFDGIDGSRAGPIRHNLTLINSPADGVNIKLHSAD
ncbi:hypothetical protein XA68_17756 [Ophiocordyceps unilateralis]|uniref:Cytochrome P450 n=1 Tax=Ophiocordyceps unilateralis TaxID=268505 RepID=A0A2A9PRT5_OPHUN|nr:hypothetical protein XA68_17756 [Ophiocordyceps unilateralis]